MDFKEAKEWYTERLLEAGKTEDISKRLFRFIILNSFRFSVVKKIRNTERYTVSRYCKLHPNETFYGVAVYKSLMH